MKAPFTTDIPADVPSKVADEYLRNYQTITGPQGRLFLFAADQKIEHLNDDFYGPEIHSDAGHVTHLFEIASRGKINAMATQLGLIARYGKHYPDINYIVKVSGKTNLIPVAQKDPLSAQLWHVVHDVLRLKEESKLHIRGIGITLYLGSEFEAEMLHHTAKAIFEAHQHGLVTIVWSYPRGKAIKDDQEPDLLAGAAGVAASLGSDFVKIKPPRATKVLTNEQALNLVCNAAGNTKVICAGQKRVEPEQLLKTVYEQLQAGTAGCAIGRNIFQRPLREALAMTEALSALVHDNISVEKALTYYYNAC